MTRAQWMMIVWLQAFLQISDHRLSTVTGHGTHPPHRIHGLPTPGKGGFEWLWGGAEQARKAGARKGYELKPDLDWRWRKKSALRDSG